MMPTFLRDLQIWGGGVFKLDLSRDEVTPGLLQGSDQQELFQLGSKEFTISKAATHTEHLRRQSRIPSGRSM